MNSSGFSFSGFPEAPSSPSYAPSSYAPDMAGFGSSSVPPSNQQGYSFISFDTVSGESSPFCDELSNLQDVIGADSTNALIGVLAKVPPAHWRNIASSLAKLVASNAQPTKFVYVAKEHRNKAVVAVKTINQNAPLPNALIAARVHNIVSVQGLVDGWILGRRRDVSLINGGFPCHDEEAIVSEYISDFQGLKGAAAIGGRQNPITSPILEATRKNLNLIAQQPPGTKSQAWKTFVAGATPHVRDKVIEAAATFYNFPKNIQDVWESTDEGKRKFAAACFQLRLAAREALASGRASRGEDNPSPLTAPWYRFGEAPKAINRLALVLALTGGKIASTTSPQVSQAFGVDQQGFHVYMDQEVSFEMLFAKLMSSGHLENDGLTLKDKVFVQLNVLGNDTNFPFEKTFNFLAKNSWNFGWAIHDGRIFVSRSGGNPPVLLPKMLAQIAAVNNLRTLHAHVPYINIVDRGVLDAWYGKMNLTTPLPAGTFSGHTINIDLAVFDQERK